MKLFQTILLPIAFIALSVIGISDYKDSPQQWKYYFSIAACAIFSIFLIGGLVALAKKK